MKKVILILSLFLLVGCSSSLTSSLTIEDAISNVLINDNKHQNTNGRGYRYYKPRDFSVVSDNGYNQVLLNNGNMFYLNVDVNAYNNKLKNEYVVDESLYFSHKFSYNDIDGYVMVKENENGYFYIKMLYNYSYIEVSVKESEIKRAIIDSTILLSSIKYNDKVIARLIDNGDLETSETTFQIDKPKNDNSSNILEAN